MTIDNHDSLLQFFDLAGNPVYVGQASVKLPMTIFPAYIKCAKGADAARRADRARRRSKANARSRSCRATSRSRSIAPGSPLVGRSAQLSEPAAQWQAVGQAPPKSIELKSTEQPVELAAGETKALSFPVAKATPLASNSYPCKFKFTSDGGDADYAESDRTRR